MGRLFEEVVTAEPYRTVGGLAGRGRDESCKKARDASFAVDDGDGVEEAAHTWLGALTVVDSGRV